MSRTFVLLPAILCTVLFSSESGGSPPYLLQWGMFGGGPGQFVDPIGVSVTPDGFILVADRLNGRVQKFTPTGGYVAEFPSPYPFDVAADHLGNIFVIDQNDQMVRKYDADGQPLTSWGGSGSGDSQFFLIGGLGIDALGNVYVADEFGDRIKVFDGNGVFQRSIGSSGSGNGQFMQPVDVAVAPDGSVLATDYGNSRIQRFTNAGVFLNKWGGPGSQPGEFNQPFGIFVDSDRRVYVADQLNSRVQVFSLSGDFVVAWGVFGSSPGAFNRPTNVVVDAENDIYVVDFGNDRIQKFGPAPLPPHHGSGHPKIALHVSGPVGKNPCSQGLPAGCPSALATGAVSGSGGPFYYLYLLVARNQAPDVSGVNCGISYDGNLPGDAANGNAIDVFSWTLCASLQFFEPGWPAPGTSNEIRWSVPSACQSAGVTGAGYFYMGAYSIDTFRVTAMSAVDPARVITCNQVSTELGPEDLGYASFSAGESLQGCNPCVIDCALATPVERTTWSGIKTQFGGRP